MRNTKVWKPAACPAKHVEQSPGCFPGWLSVQPWQPLQRATSQSLSSAENGNKKKPKQKYSQYKNINSDFKVTIILNMYVLPEHLAGILSPCYLSVGWWARQLTSPGCGLGPGLSAEGSSAPGPARGGYPGLACCSLIGSSAYLLPM